MSSLFSWNLQDQLAGDDILLIKLARPVKSSKYVSPVCLPKPNSREPRQGDQCLTAGWGLEYEVDVDHTIIPKHVNLEVASKAECGEFYGQFNITINRDMLCVGGHSEGGRDSCKYDSGGPLVCLGDNGRWQYTGITSFGAGCGSAGVPGIYTKVNVHLNWIEKTIKEEISDLVN